MNGIGIKSVLNRLLKIAVANGVENAIKVHIAKGDDLNARDDAGNTPLMIAARKKQTNACRLLLENGADPLPRQSFPGDGYWLWGLGRSKPCEASRVLSVPPRGGVPRAKFWSGLSDFFGKNFPTGGDALGNLNKTIV